MATRARQSTVEPTGTQRRAGNELPPYERPSFPLNAAAQRALDNLLRTHNLRKLDEGLSEAQAALSTTAGEINDRLHQKEQAAKKRRLQREQSSSADADADEDIERGLDEFRSKVERMTQRMDESMRKMIDAQHSVQDIKESIGATSTHARTNAATQASTQQARTQQYEDFMPTDPAAAATQNQPSPIESFRTKTEDAKTRYQSFSLTTRYAENNNYRDFRRVIHDARHPEGDVQLAHHSEWFEEAGTPAPGMTSRPRRNEDDEGSDDDIAISKAVISTTCPLTLAEFKTPLTSTKCPHSFEKDAIVNMIRRSAARDPMRGNMQVHQCPVTGCSQLLGVDDLHTDAVLVRQIKRIQRGRELEQEEVDEEEDGRNGGDGPMVINDGDDAEDVDDVIEGRSTQVKREARTQRRASKVPSTARGSRATPMEVDDGDGDDDETDDE